MQIFEKYDNISGLAKGSVLAIGNFDGVHLGHVQLLESARKIADEKGKLLAVLTFEPHPRKLFRPDEPPFRITHPDLKRDRLEKAGVDIVFSLTFDWAFASQSAEDFVQKVLKEGINPAHVVVGYDFRFGQLRKGAPDMIEAAIPTTIIEEIVCADKTAFSSSRIRQALRHGKISEANKMLGWEWEIWGEVIQGDQRGRELGYPTANLGLGDVLHPAYGVYASLVQLEGEEEWRPAATNIGIRPMFEVPVAQVESYIFDFDQDIYGQRIKVKPVQIMRGEAKFDTLDALVAQMGRDCDQARDILGV